MAVGDVAVSTSGPPGGPGDFTVTALATTTGRQLWQAPVPASQIWTTIGPGSLLITRFSDPDHAAIEGRDPRTGARRWQSGDIGPVGLPVTDGATIITYSPKDARGFAAADGHPLWTMPGSYQAAAVTTDAAYLAQPKPPKNQPPQGD
jgi:outer membrane protein assembly factor BamB